MKDPDIDQVSQLLRDALPPADTRLKRDLWPHMLRRFERGHSPAIRKLTPAECVLVIGLAAWFWFFPSAISILLYQI